MNTVTKEFKISGMHCFGCEQTIGDSLKEAPGIIEAKADYQRQSATIVYDPGLIDELAIRGRIEAKGYGVDEAAAPLSRKALRSLIFLLLLVSVGGLVWWGKSLIPGILQQINPHMSHTLLFGIGVLTGFHCIGMCGGFVVGYTIAGQSKARQLAAHLLYGFGKTLSYAVLGAGFGLLGSIIAITPQMRGAVTLLAGAFVLLYGLKMLNVFALLRRFSLRWPHTVNRRLTDGLRRHRSPFAVGLLNGLVLGCGPLQAMYVMAAGTGDPLQGALFLLLFGLGTLIPLIGFGLFAVLLSPATMRQLVSVSGVLMIAMGLMMTQRGLKLSRSAAAMPPAAMQAPAPSPENQQKMQTGM